MSNIRPKLTQQPYMKNKYLGGTQLFMPSGVYLKSLKNLQEKYQNSKKSKAVLEFFKKFALDGSRNNINNKKKPAEVNITMPKGDILKLLKAVYEIIDPLLIKINHNFKNERRKNYEDNDKYMETIKLFEQQKLNLLTFTLKSMCKVMKVKYTLLQSSVFYHIQKNELEIVEMINSFTKLGKLFALAPKNLSLEDLTEILKIYNENLNYLITSSLNTHNNQSENNPDYLKYALILINDIIYENYGLEEEQVFAFIEDKKLMENKEINYYVTLIRNTIVENITSLFDI